jgi:cytochrome c-type biogenesis protein CcmH
MRWLLSLALILALMGATPVVAVQPDEMLRDHQLETRARNLSRELRCLVCQNQSIDDSDASLARDLRILLRERLTVGDSDQQVLDFLTARYGEFILLRPRFNLNTALLWLLPATFLMIGALAAVVFFRRQPKGSETEAKLTQAERARLADLVESRSD